LFSRESLPFSHHLIGTPLAQNSTLPVARAVVYLLDAASVGELANKATESQRGCMEKADRTKQTVISQPDQESGLSDSQGERAAIRAAWAYGTEAELKVAVEGLNPVRGIHGSGPTWSINITERD
jgi:hypothetical protein